MAAIPLPDGSFQIVLSGVERKLLAQVCLELRAELESGSDDEMLRRLYPTAHPDDPEQERFYEQMTRGELTDGRIEALSTVIDTVEADVLEREQVEAWMVAVNAVRLVLGTRLDVSEDDDPADFDPDDPDNLPRLVYELLGVLLATLVTGLRLAGDADSRDDADGSDEV